MVHRSLNRASSWFQSKDLFFVLGKTVVGGRRLVASKSEVMLPPAGSEADFVGK